MFATVLQLFEIYLRTKMYERIGRVLDPKCIGPDLAAKWAVPDWGQFFLDESWRDFDQSWPAERACFQSIRLTWFHQTLFRGLRINSHRKI